MSRRGLFVIAPLIGIIVIGLLVSAGRFLIYRFAWSQGYTAGLLAYESQEGALMPALPYAHLARPFGLGTFLCAPALLLIVGGILLLACVGKCSRHWAWHKAMVEAPAGGSWFGPLEWHRHWHHGHVPPWCWGPEKPPGRKSETDQRAPDVEPAAAEAEGEANGA